MCVYLSVLTASVCCLVKASHSHLKSIDNELTVLHVYYLYAGFIHCSHGYSLVSFYKIAYASWKRKSKKLIPPRPFSVFFSTIGIKAGPSEEPWSLEGRSLKMKNHEGMGSI